MARARRSTRRAALSVPGSGSQPAAAAAAAQTPPGPRRGRRLLAVALVIVLAIGAVYGQTGRHEFIDFDDDTYIFNNPAVTQGLTWRGFLWSFGFHAGNWHPLTWLSHMLDAQLFGLRAGGHHLVNVGFHMANAVLLLAVLAALTGAFWRSAAVAALFALHPLRVESVAWAAERKDVLSALLWLCTMGAYLRYVRRPGTGRYLAVFGLFALGLTAKPMLVTLPFALLLLDGWPLGRALPPGERRLPQAPGFRGWPALVVEKAPFFVLTLVSSLVTMRGQTHNVLPFVTPELGTRLANAAVSYVRYLETFFWPAGLAFLYPYPRAGLPWGRVAAATAALVAITAAAAVCARRRPYLPLGWLWYLGTLVPVAGFMQVGGQSRSDRYTYLTMIGVALSLVWLAADLWPRRTAARRALAGAFVAALAALAVLSATYVGVWKDSLTLFGYTVRVTKENYIVLNNYGSMLMSAGRTTEAIGVLQETERINPGHCNASYNLGVTLIRAYRFQEALAPLSRSLACYEHEGRVGVYIADTHYNLGVALLGLGRFAEAEGHFQALLRIVPDYPNGRRELAEALARQGKAPAGHP